MKKQLIKESKKTFCFAYSLALFLPIIGLLSCSSINRSEVNNQDDNSQKSINIDNLEFSDISKELLDFCKGFSSNNNNDSPETIGIDSVYYSFKQPQKDNNKKYDYHINVKELDFSGDDVYFCYYVPIKIYEDFAERDKEVP